MKPLGPYVAARDLPGRMNSPVRTLRATDRLTGMPVLLHGLPGPLPLPDLPGHPGVLPFAECVLVAGEAFMVTELPLQARPAQDPDLTARGALAALAALHERGVVHGGLSASQLWSVDGEVRLAGAGLPWGGEARPADDLYALAVILHEMGGVPGALRPLLDAPGTLDARAALRLLRAPTPARLRAAPDTPGHTESAPAAPVTPDPALTAPTPADPTVSPAVPAAQVAAAQTTPVQASAGQVDPVQASTVQASPVQTAPGQAALAPVDPVPDSPPAGDAPEARGRRGRGSRFRLPGLGAAREAAAPDGPTVPTAPAAPGPAPAPARAEMIPSPAPVVPASALTPPPAAAIRPDDGGTDLTADAPVQPDAPAHDGTPIVLGDGASPAPAGTGVSGMPQESPVLPDRPQPGWTGGRLSPQERRRREHEARQEHAQRDAQAAAERRAQRLEQRRQEHGAQEPPVAPAPIQIGFDDLPEWEPDAPAPHRGVQIREVPRLPESLRRAPLPGDPAAGEDQGPAAEVPVGALPARRRVGEPIRIGWDEDDSWRVVREAPAPVRTRRPLVWRALFWVVLAAAFVGMALLLTRVVQARGAGPVTPASVPQVSGTGAASGRAAAAAPEVPAGPQPQTVQFTVRGVAGATARLSVEQAPKEANLAPGASLGTAPGRVTFPAPGTYRLRVVVDGFAPGSMTVTVPRSQPVTIDLDR
ncbi:PEGA domain-containing protein [Deinococcus daejeonensis]|nr:PEGA domain-containing protein [Deinococcus daejeonensis]